MIRTSDVGLTASHSPDHTSSYPEHSAGAAIPLEMGLRGSSLCWSVAAGEEAWTCKVDLPSDADCSMLEVVFLSAAYGFKCYREIRKVQPWRWRRKERNKNNLIMNILCRHVMPLACSHGLISINQRGRDCF